MGTEDFRKGLFEGSWKGGDEDKVRREAEEEESQRCLGLTQVIVCQSIRSRNILCSCG